MPVLLLHNARLIDAVIDCPIGWIVVDGEIIADLGEGNFKGDISNFDKVIDARGAWVMPGVIDEHVHFREPGLTHKADIASESRAAAAGGVTTFFDMPNTKPPTTCLEAWEKKMESAVDNSVVNYSFFIGATSENIDFLKSAPYDKIPGIKLFMGSTTGTGATDDEGFLHKIMSETSARIAVHAEDEQEIERCRVKIIEETGSKNIPVNRHPDIRSRLSCINATGKILRLAEEHLHPVHLMHISTAEECNMLVSSPLYTKLVTAETCPQYLLFNRTDYEKAGSKIKCNPSVKDNSDRENILKALIDGRIDIVSTDHAPHLLSEKEGTALTSASGLPGVQFSLPLMLTVAEEHHLSPSFISRVMSANPAEVWKVDRRGYLRRGYYGDLVMIKKDVPYKIERSQVISSCGWSPYEGRTVRHRVLGTWVNGTKVYSNEAGCIAKAGLPVVFNN